MSQRRTPTQVADAIINQMTRELNAQDYRNWHRGQVQELRQFTSKNKKSLNQK